MTKLRVLFVNDFASTAFLFEKYMPCEIDAIYFGDHPAISPVKNKIYFKGNLNNWIKQIKELSKKYDLFVCLGWPAAAICYLASVNYVMYFVDSLIEPEDRLRKKMPSFQRNMILEIFKEALNHSNKVVAGGIHSIELLKKYRPDARQIFTFADPQMFNPDAKKIDLGQQKFTFLSPQRIEEGKGQLLLWEAVKMTKSDFVVLQTDWGDNKYYEEAISKKPEKVKIIPKIRRDNMPSYYVSADALLGQISPTHSSSIEREAALCGIPVFCYISMSLTDDEPFYMESKEPEEIAKYIDRIVQDNKFREELAKRQLEWVLRTFDTKKNAQKWQSLFEEAVKQKRNYKVETKFFVMLWLLSIYQKITKKEFDVKFLQRKEVSIFTDNKT
ncbi:MAG: glycosyltransferase [Nitrosotalea sp.]